MSEVTETVEFGLVRRFEAAGFRAWPAASVHYDGTWLIRLTAGHPAKRLNSVNPLDPNDSHNLQDRIERARRRFEAYGRPLVFRMSPLAGRVLGAYFDRSGWDRFSESVVMRVVLTEDLVRDGMHQIPLQDLGRFVTAALKVHDLDASRRPGLTEVISSIEPETGLFVLEDGGLPLATAICVLDGHLAGLFEVATLSGERGKGYGRRVVQSALKWAAGHGARFGWLQVEADNDVAIALYRSLGFREAYRYHYRRPPQD